MEVDFLGKFALDQAQPPRDALWVSNSDIVDGVNGWSENCKGVNEAGCPRVKDIVVSRKVVFLGVLVAPGLPPD